MRCLAVLVCVATTAARAQQPTPPPPPPPAPDSVRAESALVRAESVIAPPPPPSREQKRFLDGLRTATRGIAQLKDGLARVTRTQSKSDSVSQRRAGRLLAGLCGSARAFMGRGRPYMKPAVYEDSTRLKARRLTTQMDSLIAYTTSCEQTATATPVPVAAELTKRMKSYDIVLRDFRLAVGLPVKPDSSPPTRHP
jgi:hypothetical protein